MATKRGTTRVKQYNLNNLNNSKYLLLILTTHKYMSNPTSIIFIICTILKGKLHDW